MVSLSRSMHSNAGGATFFSEPANMEDNEYVRLILESYGAFKPIRTIPIFTLHTLAALGLEVAAIVLAVMHPDETTKCREYFILIYAHVGFWFLTLILDQLARKEHYNLRINGYLDFYKRTQAHYRLPMYVVSLFNTAILFLQALMQHYYPDNFAEKCIKGGLLSPINYFCALITLEYCVLTGTNINYILLVRKFNIQKSPPDVQKGEWNACSTDHSFAEGEVGYQQIGEKVYDFIEKQADMIRHLKDHNARLGEKLMMLVASLQSKNPNTRVV